MSKTSLESSLVPERRRILDDLRMRRWSFVFNGPFGMLLAALLLPGGLLVLAWMLCSRLRRCIAVHRGAVSAARVLTSSAPQHGPPAGDARGATAERKH